MAPDSLEVDDVSPDASPKRREVDSTINYTDKSQRDSQAKIHEINEKISFFSSAFPKSVSIETSTPRRGTETENIYESRATIGTTTSKDVIDGRVATEEFPRKKISDIIKQLGLQDISTLSWNHSPSPRYKRSVDEATCDRKIELQEREPKSSPKPVPLPRMSKLLQINTLQTAEKDDQTENENEKSPITAAINGSAVGHEECSDAEEAALVEDLNKSCESDFDETSFEPDGPDEQTFKVVFVGDAGVGKSSFAMRLSKGVFVRQMSSTLGVDFLMRTLRVDGRNVAVQLWDTAGQERFRSITKSYFRKADGVLLLYDCTCEQSFLNVRQWVEDVDSASSNKIPLMIVANKIDLRQMALKTGKPCVSTQEGEKLAKDCDTTFIEASAKDGSNVIRTLAKLIRMMSSHHDLQVTASTMQLSDEKPKKAGGCCGK